MVEGEELDGGVEGLGGYFCVAEAAFFTVSLVGVGGRGLGRGLDMGESTGEDKGQGPQGALDLRDVACIFADKVVVAVDPGAGLGEDVGDGCEGRGSGLGEGF